MTPELIAILALGVPLIGLLLTFRRDARADNQALRADNQALRVELRAEIQNLRAESRAENHALRAEVLAQIQDLRKEVQAGDQRLREDVHAEMSSLRTDVSNLSTDVQALTERTARLEGAIQGLAATHHDHTRRDDAA
ncbi:MAG: hypothetical protein OXR64_04730 [Chloroflexota bacterium]|nr:hypothetical protein [Chloroflexota bacterium]MDE2919131.1 hypothetical protein [Chloroflexota bacterium]